MEQVLIAVGVMSLALLWIFAAFGGAMALWDTYGDHIAQLWKRFKS